MELQDSTAAAVTPSGGYAFMIAGMDFGGSPLAMGGIINVDGAPGTGAISGTGSIFDANDGGSGFAYQGETFAASTVSAPDSFGRVVFTLNPNDSTHFSEIALAGYIVDPTHIRLVETSDSFLASTGGVALGRGTNTCSSIAGNSYVVGLAGGHAIGGFQAAGVLTAGSTAVSGMVNYNDLTGTGVQAPDPVTEGTLTYTLDPINPGRVSIPGMTDTLTGANFNLQLYLDGNGNALAITLDDSDVASGLGYQQIGGSAFTAGSFEGSYTFDAVGVDSTDENLFSAVGHIKADGVGTLNTGAADLNWMNNSRVLTQFPDLPVSGTFTAAASGVFTGTITGLDVTTATNSNAFTYYMIDTTRAVAIETDPNQLTLGYFQLQQ